MSVKIEAIVNDVSMFSQYKIFLYRYIKQYLKENKKSHRISKKDYSFLKSVRIANMNVVEFKNFEYERGEITVKYVLEGYKKIFLVGIRDVKKECSSRLYPVIVKRGDRKFFSRYLLDDHIHYDRSECINSIKSYFSNYYPSRDKDDENIVYESSSVKSCSYQTLCKNLLVKTVLIRLEKNGTTLDCFLVQEDASDYIFTRKKTILTRMKKDSQIQTVIMSSNQ